MLVFPELEVRAIFLFDTNLEIVICSKYMEATKLIMQKDLEFDHFVRPKFFRFLYIKLFRVWLFFDGKRVMRDYKKGRLRKIKSLDELM